MTDIIKIRTNSRNQIGIEFDNFERKCIGLHRKMEIKLQKRQKKNGRKQTKIL